MIKTSWTRVVLGMVLVCYCHHRHHHHQCRLSHQPFRQTDRETYIYTRRPDQAVKWISGAGCEGVSDLCGRTLELQQHQGTGTLQDVEVEEQGLLPDDDTGATAVFILYSRLTPCLVI